MAIEGYLDYCRRNGVSVGVATARGYVSDALRRSLASDEEAWKAALNWFFREGRKHAAPRPHGRAALLVEDQADSRGRTSNVQLPTSNIEV
jgi:hypothetical protein